MESYFDMFVVDFFFFFFCKNKFATFAGLSQLITTSQLSSRLRQPQVLFDGVQLSWQFVLQDLIGVASYEGQGLGKIDSRGFCVTNLLGFVQV